jgi:hypothetical protein
MKKLLLAAAGAGALVVPVIAIVAIASPASGGTAKHSSMAAQPVTCSFGYVDLPATAERICVPTLFKVQRGDTISGIAKSWGYPTGWHTMCNYRWEREATAISWPGFDPHLLPTGSYVGGCPRNHRDLDSVLQRMSDDQHKPSSTDAWGPL